MDWWLSALETYFGKQSWKYIWVNQQKGDDRKKTISGDIYDSFEMFCKRYIYESITSSDNSPDAYTWAECSYLLEFDLKPSQLH